MSANSYETSSSHQTSQCAPGRLLCPPASRPHCEGHDALSSGGQCSGTQEGGRGGTLYSAWPSTVISQTSPPTASCGVRCRVHCHELRRASGAEADAPRGGRDGGGARRRQPQQRADLGGLPKDAPRLLAGGAVGGRQRLHAVPARDVRRVGLRLRPLARLHTRAPTAEGVGA